MRCINTDLPDVKLLLPRRYSDLRGTFCETFSRRACAEAGIPDDFVQDNHVLSHAAGTVRGLHFQIPPFAQGKLVRVLKGAIFDVAVDLRRHSPTYGRHVAAHLDATTGAQLYVPGGFAHGYCTLEAGTEVAYKVSAPWSPVHEGGVLWHDPDLAIDWPVGIEAAITNDRDAALPRLRDLVPTFGRAA